MARFGEINAQYFDDAGDPLGSGKLYFYESGTTTAKTTYADINLTIPNTNPVILTAAGRQPNIFFNGNAKGILTDKNDVQILVRDPVGETGTNFGDAWVATKIYSSNSVVIGSDGVYYRSLDSGNQNNNPTTTSGFWTLLYSVDWNSGITYQTGAMVTVDGEQYQSLQDGNVGNDPTSSPSYWVLLSFAWLATATYAEDQNAVGTDGVLYTSLQNANTGNDPATSPAYWVGTSAAAAASATAAAASATAAAASETAAETAETNAANSATAAASSATDSANSATASAGSATAASGSATAASGSATAAAGSATAAATSAADAAATYDQFDDRYLGVKSSDPATDNDGNPLVTGALYFSSTTNTMRVYNGSGWQDTASITTSVSLSQISDFPSQTGQSGKYLTTNGTIPSWVEVSASPTLEATASGALANGDTVIVNADGTVSAVSGDAETFGTSAAINSSTSIYINSIFDSNSNKVVVVYNDSGNAGYGTAAVGTVSGTSITFGTPVVFQSASVQDLTATFDSSSNKAVIVYRNPGNSSYGTAIVGTVSGTSISFGTAVVFNSATSVNISATFDTNSNKVVIAYRNSGNSNRGTAIVGTVSGTSITFGTAVVFYAGSTNTTRSTFDSNSNKVVVFYVDAASSNYGTAIVGTVSGTSITFGTSTVFNSGSTNPGSATFDSTSNKVVLAYRNNGNSGYGTAIVGTVSGTSISFGAAVVFNTASSNYSSIVFIPSLNVLFIAYADGGNSNYGTSVLGTVSGTSISFGAPLVFNTATSNFMSSILDTNLNRLVAAYQDGGNSNYATAIVYRPEETNLTNENYIGISDAAYSDAETAKIQIVGSVDDSQSGLTAGQSLYVQLDGTLSTTPAVPAVFAGTAVSATKLIVKG